MKLLLQHNMKYHVHMKYQVFHLLSQWRQNNRYVYETPYEDEENYGPIYSAPSSDEQKIYEEFEGKRFRKLHHTKIR